MEVKRTSVLLFGLCILLLLVISARVSPDESRIASETALSGDGTEDAVPVDALPQESYAADAGTEEPEETEPALPTLPEPNIGSWQLMLVDSLHVLSSSFAPDVTEVRDGQYFDSRAAEELLEMISGAEKAGYTVTIRTGYRPYATQAYIFFGKASQIAWDGTVEYADAEELARETVAYPGTSEHQLGLAVDLMDSAGTAMVAEDVEELPVLLWLQEHCAEYGFIYRYPKEKQEITGWYEPWHFRYVGKDAATYIMENDLCLEEFIELY